MFYIKNIESEIVINEYGDAEVFERDENVPEILPLTDGGMYKVYYAFLLKRVFWEIYLLEYST